MNKGQLRRYGALKENVTQRGIIQGTTLTKVTGRENIDFVRKLAQRKGITETLLCNSILQEALTQLREEHEKAELMKLQTNN